MNNIMRADARGPVGIGPASLTDLQRYRSFVDECGVEYAADWFVYTVTIPSLVPAATRSVPLNIQSDSAFEWLATTAQLFDSSGNSEGGATGAIEITIVDSASARNLSNAAVPIGLMAGAGGAPFINPIPRRFMPQTQITVVAHNYSSATTFGTAASGACQISFIGRKIFIARPTSLTPAGYGGFSRFNTWTDQISGRAYTEDLYSYVIKPGTLTNAAAALDTNILIEADSDFEWLMTGFCSGEPFAKSADLSTIAAQITDGGTNRQLLSRATDLSNLVNTNFSTMGFFPFVMLQPRIFLSKAPVTLTLQNKQSASDITLTYFVMHGRKIFELN
jgi:hypothetical protein